MCENYPDGDRLTSDEERAARRLQSLATSAGRMAEINRLNRRIAELEYERDQEHRNDSDSRHLLKESEARVAHLRAKLAESEAKREAAASKRVDLIDKQATLIGEQQERIAELKQRAERAEDLADREAERHLIRIAELEALVDKLERTLSKTADGKTLTDGMTYFVERAGRIVELTYKRTGLRTLPRIFSTREAAEAAKGGE